MALLKKNGLWNFSKNFIKLSSNLSGKHLQNITPISTHLHYSSMKDSDSKIVLSNNGQIICCWHPKQDPPYEHTRPIPIINPEFNEEDSVLKVQYRRHAKHRFQPDGPTIPELAKLTYTTKHRWYPNNEKKYIEPFPDDREGI